MEQLRPPRLQRLFREAGNGYRRWSHHRSLSRQIRTFKLSQRANVTANPARVGRGSFDCGSSTGIDCNLPQP